MNETALLAVTVLYYNKTRLTRTCVDSILDAGYPADLVYCFDNGSKAEVFEEIRDLYPGCNHLRAEDNRGFSGGFNRALDWVFRSGPNSTLFLTNDTIMTPGALEACEKTASETGAGLVAPLVTYQSNHDNIDSIGAFFDFEKGLLRHYHEKGLPLLLEPGKDYIPGTAIWVNKKTFEQLEGTDESYHMYWEDVDMCFRAHKEKILQARCYDAVIRHGGGQTTRKKPLYTTFYFQRNRIRFCKTYLEGKKQREVLNLIRAELEQSAATWQENNDNRRLDYYERLMEELTASL